MAQLDVTAGQYTPAGLNLATGQNLTLIGWGLLQNGSAPSKLQITVGSQGRLKASSFSR